MDNNMKILIASGDSGRLTSLSDYLKYKGFNILTAMDGAAFL